MTFEEWWNGYLPQFLTNFDGEPTMFDVKLAAEEAWENAIKHGVEDVIGGGG